MFNDDLIGGYNPDELNDKEDTVEPQDKVNKLIKNPAVIKQKPKFNIAQTAKNNPYYIG